MDRNTLDTDDRGMNSPTKEQMTAALSWLAVHRSTHPEEVDAIISMLESAKDCLTDAFTLLKEVQEKEGTHQTAAMAAIAGQHEAVLDYHRKWSDSEDNVKRLSVTLAAIRKVVTTKSPIEGYAVAVRPPEHLIDDVRRILGE